MGAQHGGLASRLLAHRGLWDAATPPNSQDALARALAQGLGVETDLRDADGTVVISHDPPSGPVLSAQDGLARARSGIAPAAMLALNVKSDGLLPLLAPLTAALPGDRHFFFDMSWPQTLAFVAAGLPVALRVSEWEPFSQDVFSRLGIPVSLWLDAFDSDWWLTDPGILELSRHGQVAIVSPEIHGRPPEAVWEWFGQRWEEGGDVYLCTDRCDDVMRRLA